MIRHAGGAAGAVLALLIAMIETACRGLLMAAIGGAALRAARLFPARQTAIDLPAFARRADEEDETAGTTALPKGSGTNRMHCAYGHGLDSAAARHGECVPRMKVCCAAAQPPDEKPRLRKQPGLCFAGKMTGREYGKAGVRETPSACGDEGAPAAMKRFNTHPKKMKPACGAEEKGGIGSNSSVI